MEKDIVMELNDVTLLLFKHASSRYKKMNIDITPMQARILMAIHNSKDVICQKYIENYVACNKSTISNVLDTMEKNGLIKRIDNEDDLRRKNIVLTEKSELILKQLKKAKEKLMNEVTEGITDKEMKILDDVLEKIKYNLERCKND